MPKCSSVSLAWIKLMRLSLIGNGTFPTFTIKIATFFQNFSDIIPTKSFTKPKI